MKTIRPYKGIYKLKIHRHSKVRYRQSKHILDTEIGFVAYIEPPYFEVFTGRKWPSLVTDLKRVPRGVNYITLNMDGTANKPIIHWENIIATDKELKSIEKNIAYPETKKLGFWRNLWQNKIKKLRRK